MRKAFIKAISYYLPETVITNEQLVAEFPEWTVEKIASKVGVNQRHIATEGETALDLAEKACIRLFEENPTIKREDIDFLVLCTQSPDYILPTSACILQDRLGLNTNIGAFDFNLGCSGYIYGLAIAKGILSAGIAANILLVTAETYNKHLHPRDKGNRTIFGDGASATVISTEGIAEIGEFSLGTDGKGAENLIIKSYGARHPEKADDLTFDENGNPVSSDWLYMNGSEIFMFTQKAVPKLIKKNIEVNGLTMDDISLVVLHQANSFMLEFLRKKMKIDEDKFFINMAEIGNTVSNSIPIALRDAHNANLLSGIVLVSGFGVGYSYGACVLKCK